ncbi:MAG: phosphate/phosphite/phosphonate ABC transporter substrate-binding protein [Terriglobales bacterium]
MLPRTRATKLLVICLLLIGSLYGADRPITVGLVYDGSTPAERAPLEAYLTKAMGRSVQLAAPDLYSATVANLVNGSYDFACLGALMYVRSHAKYGVVPLVQRTSDQDFHSVFITWAGSPIHSLTDLKGKQFAFGDINSASAHLIPYRELKDAGLNPENDLKTRFSGSHVATAALVATGVVDAGVLDETVFNSLLASGKLDRNKVRVFHTSKAFVDYVYVARKDLPAAEREKFVRALLALKEGKNDDVLKILRAQQFVPANDEEYAPVLQIAHELKMF